jgi:putative ABC transport system substrate-binding protein
MLDIKRRKFIALVGGGGLLLTAKAKRARAQQPAMPVIGFLHAQSPDGYTELLRRFRQGLKENGYVEGETVAIEYRWAESQMDRLPSLAAELVHRKVAVIAATGGHASAIAAKVATTEIPIVFVAGDDPVRLGLVASLARPGGNLTGVNFFAEELATKRLELLHELLPAAACVAVLVNPTSPDFGSTIRNVEAAARTIGLQIQVLNASSSREINEAFATFVWERPDALLAGTGPPFTGRRAQLVQLAAFHRIPAIYAGRQNAEIGGLMSYGASLTDTYRQLGVYTSRILKGAKPADLPVVQSSKFELVINAETARMLGLTVPSSLLARADEVIE